MASTPPQDTPADEATVFVDLDRCLLIDDSVSGSLARLVARGVARRRALVKGMWMYTGYRMNWLDAEGLVAAGVADLAGIPEAIVDEEAEAYFQEAARYRYRRAMLAELDLHRAAGRPIWLLTGGLPYLAARIAADLGLDGVAATRPEIEGGLFTGSLVERPASAPARSSTPSGSPKLWGGRCIGPGSTATAIPTGRCLKWPKCRWPSTPTANCAATRGSEGGGC